MKKLLNVVTASVVLVLIVSCSPVKFYSDTSLTKRTGLKYYTAKPYLQVERDTISKKVVKATVIYLPDLSEPVYMVAKDGLGSRKIDVRLTDGVISTLSIASDPKVAETIESLAALITKTASAVTDLSALKGIPQASSQFLVTELYEVSITHESTSLKKVEFPKH